MRFRIDWHETVAVEITPDDPRWGAFLLEGQSLVEVAAGTDPARVQALVEQASLAGYVRDECMARLESLAPGEFRRVESSVASEPTGPRAWEGPVLVVYLNDSRTVGPFPDAAAATRWLRAVPNALFADALELEHARGNGDVFLTALEDPGTASRGGPLVEHGPEWDAGWGPKEESA